MISYGIVITTLTDTHVTSETWTVTEEAATALREALGEPEIRQMSPIEIVNKMLEDENHIVLE